MIYTESGKEILKKKKWKMVSCGNERAIFPVTNIYNKIYLLSLLCHLCHRDIRTNCRSYGT